MAECMCEVRSKKQRLRRMGRMLTLGGKGA